MIKLGKLLRRLAAAGIALLVPDLAYAQSALPPTPLSPWSLHEMLGAPDGLKISGSVRARYETIDGQARPGFNDSDDLINFRTNLFVEYDTGSVRVGAELFDSRAYAADAGTPVTTSEGNALELAQAYVAADLPGVFGKRTGATVQIGRLAFGVGSRRLIVADEYRNTMSSYTGVKADLNSGGGVKATLLYVLPVTRLPDDRPSLIDNRVRFDREGFEAVLWGGVVSAAGLPGAVTGEVTYLHFGERDRSGRPTRDRSLDTVGGRVFREPKAGVFDFEVESFAQFGSIAATLAANARELRVRAAFAHGEVGYQFAGAAKAHVVARFDYASGDRPGGRYDRFDPLFGSRRADLGPAGLFNAIARTNILSPALRFEGVGGTRTDAFVQYRAFWLASRSDAFSATGVRDAAGGSGRFAGHQIEARVRQWLVPGALRIEVDGVYLAKGRFLEAAPNAPRDGDTKYLSLNLTAYF